MTLRVMNHAGRDVFDTRRKREMNRIKSILAAAAMAVVGAAVAAPLAQAQSIAPVIEYKTVGGFTMFNSNLKVYSSGFAVVSQVRHDGTSLIMTDYLTSAQV